MLNGIVLISYLAAAILMPVHFCKPVHIQTETDLNKDQVPCHVTAEMPIITNTNLTQENLKSLAQRSVTLIAHINEIKQKIIKGGAILEKCVTSKFSHGNFSLPCSNIMNMTKQETVKCMVSSYNIINQFSVSVKAIQNGNFSTKKNLKDVLNQIGSVKTYSDQFLCEIYIDLKHLDHNISFVQQSQENITILNDFTEQAKTEGNNACFHVGSELSQLQLLHVIYQFLDTFSNIFQEMKELFSSENNTYTSKSDILQSRPITSAVTSSSTVPKHVPDLPEIIIG